MRNTKWVVAKKKGVGSISVDLTEAAHLFKLSAAQNHAQSHFESGCMYEDGNTALQSDKQKAFFHFKWRPHGGFDCTGISILSWC